MRVPGPGFGGRQRADVLAQLDRQREAQELLQGFAVEGFSVPLEMQWLFSLSLLPEVCWYLGDAPSATRLYELLSPYEDRNALTPPDLCRGCRSCFRSSFSAEKLTTYQNQGMRLFHVSDHAELILEEGFEDGRGFYREGKLHRGVWLFDKPTEEGPDQPGMARTVVLDVPDEVALRYEWLEEGSHQRRFLIPARILNRFLGTGPTDRST